MASTKIVARIEKGNLAEDLMATVYAPSDLDPRLVKLGLILFLGGLNAISKCNNSETKKEYLIRYIASLANSADTALRSTQMVNKTESSNHKQIVEDLLKSLH